MISVVWSVTTIFISLLIFKYSQFDFNRKTNNTLTAWLYYLPDCKESWSINKSSLFSNFLLFFYFYFIFVTKSCLKKLFWAHSSYNTTKSARFQKKKKTTFLTVLWGEIKKKNPKLSFVFTFIHTQVKNKVNVLLLLSLFFF